MQTGKPAAVLAFMEDGGKKVGSREMTYAPAGGGPSHAAVPPFLSDAAPLSPFRERRAREGNA